jgi:hypothetical protein
MFWTIRQQMDIARTASGDPAPHVVQFLCPTRRPYAAGGQARADFGWSNDPSSVLGSADPVEHKAITDGIGNTLLISHIAIRPKDYGGGDWDSPWNTNTEAFARNPAPLYLDKEAPDSFRFMGSPHPSAVPHCFCDCSVRTIDYEWARANPEMLRKAWQYNRKAGTINQVIGNN